MLGGGPQQRGAPSESSSGNHSANWQHQTSVAMRSHQDGFEPVKVEHGMPTQQMFGSEQQQQDLHMYSLALQHQALTDARGSAPVHRYEDSAVADRLGLYPPYASSDRAEGASSSLFSRENLHQQRQQQSQIEIPLRGTSQHNQHDLHPQFIQHHRQYAPTMLQTLTQQYAPSHAPRSRAHQLSGNNGSERNAQRLLQQHPQHQQRQHQQQVGLQLQLQTPSSRGVPLAPYHMGTQTFQQHQIHQLHPRLQQSNESARITYPHSAQPSAALPGFSFQQHQQYQSPSLPIADLSSVHHQPSQQNLTSAQYYTQQQHRYGHPQNLDVSALPPIAGFGGGGTFFGNNNVNPGPSFAHFAANITQMPNQVYYQPVMYHQPHPMPAHAMSYGGIPYVMGGPASSAYGVSGTKVVGMGGALSGTASFANGASWATMSTSNGSSGVPLVPLTTIAQPHHTKEWFDHALALAHDKYNQQDYTGAYHMLLSLHQADLRHFPTLLLLGCTCYSLNLYELSIMYNNQILQMDPKFAEAFSNLGTTYRAMSQTTSAAPGSSGTCAYDLQMAEQYYRMAISIRPKYWDASINLAGLLSANGRFDEAIQVYAAYEREMEEGFPAEERLDLIVGDLGGGDADMVVLLTDMEKRRSARLQAEKVLGRRIPSEASGWTDGRRRDLYYAKASLLYAMNHVNRAKMEYLKGLISIGLDLCGTYAHAASGVLTVQFVTPQQASAALQQQQTQKGLSSNPEFNATASGMLQTLAKIYQDLQQTSLAVSLYYVALSIFPNANTCNNIGILLAGQRLAEALAWYEFGLSLEPNHVHLLTNLGSALKDSGQVHEGITCYLRAISIQADFFIALANLANVYKDLGRVEEAIDLYRRSLEVKPDFVEAFCNYVNSLLFVCQWDDRTENLKRIHLIVETQLREGVSPVDRIPPGGTGNPRVVPTVLPFHTFTYAGLSAWQVREICRRNGARVLHNVNVLPWFPGFTPRPAKLLREKPVEHDLTPDQIDRLLRYPYPYPLPPTPSPRIHIGYLSSDFNNHPLAHLMQSVFGMHDRSRFKVFCYSLSPSDSSAYREKIEREADVFADVHAWSVQQIVERVVADGIHVLCNLNGYTKGGRNEVFAARPAPVQMQFMGFAGSMGSGSLWDPDHNPEESWIAEIEEEDEDEEGDDPVANARREDALRTMDSVPYTWLDYLLTDEIATPRKFVCGEPIAADEQPWSPTRNALQPRPVDRGLVRKRDDANRVFTEALVYMPNTYFVNDHRQGFRENADEMVDAMCGRPAPLPKPCDADLGKHDLGVWRAEQVRRLKMRREMFPWMREDTVVYANFNQLYKVDPEIFKTWLRILVRVPNSILWLLRFPPAGEQRLLQLANNLHGPSVASRVVFTDVAPKHLHIHRGRIADVFLDTPECNAHTTAADILWSGTPVVTYPRYDFKMCSRVCASVAYATGSWTDGDLAGLDSSARDSILEARKGIRVDGVSRLEQDDRLLGHWMVVSSYDEFEDAAVRLGTSMRWEWTPLVTGGDTGAPPRGDARYAAAVGSERWPLDPSYTIPAPSPFFPPLPIPSPVSSDMTTTPNDTTFQSLASISTSSQPASSSTPSSASAFFPSTTQTLHPSQLMSTSSATTTPTHVYIPTSTSLATRLRRRLFLNRDTCALFDTPRWVRDLERAVVQAYEKWENDFHVVKERNRRECAHRVGSSGTEALGVVVVTKERSKDGRRRIPTSRPAATRMWSASRCLWVGADGSPTSVGPSVGRVGIDSREGLLM
ncbi:hypothetical protein HKX48_007372 [Thoreauomyces humboldtii]|nr:hypothetical protein HKX48_007372 [Thoreauomyces humboldtii]